MLALLLPLLAFALVPDGVYRQDCRGSYQREERVSGTTVTFAETNFWNQGCADPRLRSLSYGQLEYGTANPRGIGGELDFVFSRVTITPLDAITAEQLRAIAACGISNWAENQEVEVTGRRCRFQEKVELRVPSAGERRYGIYQLLGDDLFLGRLEPRFDGTMPRRRPFFLDPSPYRLQR